MTTIVLRRSPLLALGLVSALAGGCTTLLGIDGDYAVDGSDGAGGGVGGASSTTTSADVTASAAGGGASGPTTTTSAGASSGGGDGGAGGDGGGSTTGGGMGGTGGGTVDCSQERCADEVLLEVRPGARRPHLVTIPEGDAVLTYLTGPEGFVWRGITDGTTIVEGNFVPATTAEDVAALDALDLVILEDGLVEVPAAADAPAPLLQIDPLLGGGPYAAPLFAARTADDATIRYVVAEGDRSVAFTCPGGVACAESAAGCEPTQGSVAHALDRFGSHVVVARACGPTRQLRIDRENGAALVADTVVDVVEVAVGQTDLETLAFALTLGDEGPNRRVTMTQLDGTDAAPYVLPGPSLPARDPVVEASLQGVVAVWVEDGADGPGFRIMECDALEFECTDGRLHVVGAPVSDPRALTMTDVNDGLLLAWEDGTGADATVRFAMLR